MYYFENNGCDRRVGFSPPARDDGLKPILQTLWLILLTIIVPGCCQDGPKGCNNITPGAIPQPNGTYLCQWNHAETARADQDNFVIYQYEWSAEGTKLTPFGQEHLARIAQRLPQVCFPVVIEPVSDSRLNESHRAAVMEGLANSHVPIVPERIVLGRSEAEGLYGQEAPGVAARMLSNQGGGRGRLDGRRRDRLDFGWNVNFRGGGMGIY